MGGVSFRVYKTISANIAWPITTTGSELTYQLQYYNRWQIKDTIRFCQEIDVA